MGLDVNVYLVETQNNKVVNTREIFNCLPYDIRFMWNGYTSPYELIAEVGDANYPYRDTVELWYSEELAVELTKIFHTSYSVSIGVVPYKVFYDVYVKYLKDSGYDMINGIEEIIILPKDYHRYYAVIENDQWFNESLDPDVEKIFEEYKQELLLQKLKNKEYK